MVCTHYMVSLLLSDGRVLNEAVRYLSPPNVKECWYSGISLIRTTKGICQSVCIKAGPQT